MGTDIHVVFQKYNQTTNSWEDIAHEFETNRHYKLFAWLADVRNGYGFAGTPTHTALIPLSVPRGLPKDFELTGDYNDRHLIPGPEFTSPWRRKYWDEYPDERDVWMGDHSHSWLYADEIINAEPQRILCTGVVSLETFQSWDGNSEPEGYCGGVGGTEVVVSNPTEITPVTTHVRVEWFTDLLEELEYFVDQVRVLQAKHDPEVVRIVFGFDS